jgi:GDP-L-fucose synthase
MHTELLVTGGSGMVGRALASYCPKAVYVGSNDYDLKSREQTEAMFEKYKPKMVIHLAARVGGVKANTSFIADFYSDNILINTNVLNAAREHKIEKLVSMLSTCVYPDKTAYPLIEDNLHQGPPHESNFGYAHAKRMLEVHSRALRNQHGCNFICAIPNNIFGEHDNFDLENSHVIPAIMRKIWEAKHECRDVHLWGDGSPLREFTYSKDIARALIFLLYSVNPDGPVNIGNTKECSIREAAEKIAGVLDFNRKIIWDTGMPSGQARKPSSNQRLFELGFNTDTFSDFNEAIKETCTWFKENYPYVRGVKIR